VAENFLEVRLQKVRGQELVTS